MRHRSSFRSGRGVLFGLIVLLVGGLSPQARAQCPPSGMTDQVTWPMDGATLQAGHIQFRATRGPATGLFSWVFSGPRITIWKTFGASCPCNVGSTDLYMTPVG